MSAHQNSQRRADWRRALRLGSVLALAVMLLGVLDSFSKRDLPLAAFSVIGYTNNALSGWQAIVEVTNSLPFEIKCGACSGFRKLRDEETTKINRWHRLEPKVPEQLLDEGLRPVVALIPNCRDVRRLYLRYHEVQSRAIPAHQTDQFLVRLARTNNTQVVFFYGSTRVSRVEGLRIWINAHVDWIRIEKSPQKENMVASVLDRPELSDTTRFGPEP